MTRRSGQAASLVGRINVCQADADLVAVELQLSGDEVARLPPGVRNHWVSVEINLPFPPCGRWLPKYRILAGVCAAILFFMICEGNFP